LEAGKGETDGYVSPTTYNRVRSFYVSEGGSGSDFDSSYNYYINPTHYWNLKDGVWSGTNYQTTTAPDL